MSTQNTQTETITSSSNIQNQVEENMTNETLTTEIDPRQNLIEALKLELESNPMSFSAFSQHITKIIRDEIKPLCSRSPRTQSLGDDWKAELKLRFGRGAKWVMVDISEISDSLDRFDSMGRDTSDYRAWINQHGKAWIRFAAPRLLNGQPAASFTIHLNGGSVPESKTTHLITLDKLDEITTPMTGTPKSMGIEVIKETPAEENTNETEIEDVEDSIISDSTIEDTSDDNDVEDDEDETDF